MIKISSPGENKWLTFDSFMQFSSNPNTTNLKICPNHDGLCSFERKFNINSEEKKCFEEAMEIGEDISSMLTLED